MLRQYVCTALAVTSISTACLSEGGYILEVPSEYPSIEAAWHAIPGDGTGGARTYTIQVAPGTYYGTTYLSGKTAKISGPTCVDCGDAIFDGEDAGPAFVLLDNGKTETNVTMSHCIIQNGAGAGTPSLGGGFYVGGTLQLEHCTIRNCSADSGGGMFIPQGGTCVLETGCTFDNNTAVNDGGAIYGSPGARLEAPPNQGGIFRNLFDLNLAARGGAIAFRGTAVLESAAFERNTATVSGAHVWISSDENSLFQMCFFQIGAVFGDSTTGGSLAIEDTPAYIALRNCFFIENDVTGVGAGVLVSNSLGNNADTTLECTDVYFSENEAFGGPGGGIAFFNGGALNITDSFFGGNKSRQSGGGIHIATGTCTMTNSDFLSNEAITTAGQTAQGGALFIENGVLVYEHGSVRSNLVYGGSASLGGGLMLDRSIAQLGNLHLAFNGFQPGNGDPNAQGGAIYSTWGGPPPAGIVDLLIHNCTVAGHACDRAIWLNNTGATINNTLFKSNTLGLKNEAGAILISNSVLGVTGSTFANNSTINNSGGSISAIDGSDLTVLDSIFLAGHSHFGSGGFLHLGPASALDARRNSFNNGSAGSHGGAIFIEGPGPALVLRENIFTNNNCSLEGGAIKNERASTAFEMCSFGRNSALLGGAIATSDEAYLSFSDFCGNTPEDISGPWTDLGGSTFESFCDCAGFSGTCFCVGDINFDGTVDGADLTLILAAWGECPDCIGLEDINLDGVVDGADLTLVLGAWGICS